MSFLGLDAVSVFSASGRGTYGGRPKGYIATRCVRCQRCEVFTNTSCEHETKSGWVFPQASLLWVAGEAPWVPTFWFPLNRRGADGRLAEAIVSNRLPLSVVSTRRRASACSKCGALEIFYALAA